MHQLGRGAADHELPDPGVSVGAHHQEVDTFTLDRIGDDRFRFAIPGLTGHAQTGRFEMPHRVAQPVPVAIGAAPHHQHQALNVFKQGRLDQVVDRFAGTLATIVGKQEAIDRPERVRCDQDRLVAGADHPLQVPAKVPDVPIGCFAPLAHHDQPGVALVIAELVGEITGLQPLVHFGYTSLPNAPRRIIEQ